MILCRFTVGSSLGVCVAGIVIALTMLPPMVVSFNRPRDAFVSAISILVGIAIVWLFSTANISQSLAASLILFTIGLSLLTITRTAKRWFGSSLAVAGTTVLFILWLTWPVWLSPWLAGSTGARIASPARSRKPALCTQSRFPERGPLDPATPDVPAYRPRPGRPLRTSHNDPALRSSPRLHRAGLVAAGSVVAKVVATGDSLTSSPRNSSGAKIVRANGRLIEPM